MYNSDNEETCKPLQETVLIHQGNKLKINLKFGYCYDYNVYKTKKYEIRNSTEFQIKINSYSLRDGVLQNVFIKFKKLRKNDEFTYTLIISCEGLDIKEKTFLNDNGTWQYLQLKKNPNESSVEIMVSMDIVPNIHSFPTLYDDIELTDFELRGEDGSVKMHKSVLAACSPVMKRMFSGTWRELSQGHVDVSGTSKKTLQMLKDYMYLHTLPNSGLEQLLLLASYYMMPDLEQCKCADKLIEQMSAENAWELFEFTVQHKLTNLLITLFESTDPNTVKEMREHFLNGKPSNANKDKNDATSQKHKQRHSRSTKDAHDEMNSLTTPNKLKKV